MKIAVFLAPGFEEVEALTVVDYLRRANQDVTLVSVPEDGSNVVSTIVKGGHNVSVVADILLRDYISQLAGTEPDAIYFPGGSMGAKNLAANQFLFQLATKMARKGKIVAAICASPAVVLAPTGILQDRKWTCYPGMENELAEFCGSDVKASDLMENAHHIRNVPFVLDTNILTGRGAGTTEQFAMMFVELTAGPAVAKQIHDATCQR